MPDDDVNPYCAPIAASAAPDSRRSRAGEASLTCALLSLAAFGSSVALSRLFVAPVEFGHASRVLTFVIACLMLSSYGLALVSFAFGIGSLRHPERRAGVIGLSISGSFLGVLLVTLIVSS